MTREEAILHIENIKEFLTSPKICWSKDDNKIVALHMAIEALHDRPKGDWIPCSERLPSDDEYMIVSVLDDHGDTPWKYTTVAWLCNEVWISDNDILCGTAIAWKPLPKPHREESEVEE